MSSGKSIFYSWQSQLQPKENRRLIEKAARQAINSLNAGVLAEAERVVPAVELDQDTQGVLGNPSIVDTILSKIDQCDIFLADVSIVHERTGGRGSINSNVAIELGYALGKRSSDVTVLVMNTAHGGFEKLPFDLAHRRKPIEFHLPDDASKADREEQVAKLSKALEQVFKQYFDIEQVVTPIRSVYQLPEVFWTQNQPLITSDDGLDLTPEIEYPSVHLRAWPTDEVKQLSPRQLLEIPGFLPHGCYNGEGHFSNINKRNRFGAMTYRYNRGGHLESFCQIFQNGEIWGFDQLSAMGRNDLISAKILVSDLTLSVVMWSRMARMHLGYGNSINFEYGILKAANKSLTFNLDRNTEKFFEENVVVEAQLNDDTPAAEYECIVAILEKLYDLAADPVPEFLHDAIKKLIAAYRGQNAWTIGNCGFFSHYRI